MHCQSMLSVMLDFLDMLGRNSTFKITEARHLEVMLIRQLRNKINLVDIQRSAQGEVFITAIQCQNHGFCHACIGCVRREAEVKMNIPLDVASTPAAPAVNTIPAAEPVQDAAEEGWDKVHAQLDRLEAKGR